MSPNWANKKRVLPGELDALHKPTGDSVSRDSSVRTSGGDKEIRGRAKLKGTLEVPYESSDRTPKLVLMNRGKRAREGRKTSTDPEEAV